jgi:5'(3')-deoxyribonucleotidase
MPGKTPMPDSGADGEKRFVLGVDLDGVVADFISGLRAIAAEWVGRDLSELPLQVSYGFPEWGIRDRQDYDDLHRFAVTQRALFKRLDPFPGAPAALRRISRRNVRIRIITHRLYIKHFHEEAVLQTTQWLEHHGIPYWDLCFMRDKAAVGADLYLEDTPANVEALRSGGHPTIVVTSPINRHLPGPRADTWDEIEQLVYAGLEGWERRTT